MRIYVVAFFLGNLILGAAQAQEVSRFDSKVVFRAAQCELGQFTRTLHKAAPHLPQQRGLVEVNSEDMTAVGIEGGLNLYVVHFGGTTKYEKTQGEASGRKYNISEENIVACTRRGNGNLIKLGVIECLNNQVESLYGVGYAGCSQTVVGTTTVKAGAGFQVWRIGLDASADFTVKRTFTVKVRVPDEGFTTPPPPTGVPVASPWYEPTPVPAFVGYRGRTVVAYEGKKSRSQKGLALSHSRFNVQRGVPLAFWSGPQR